MGDLFGIADVSISVDLARMKLASENLANATTPGYRREMAVTGTFQNVVDSAERAMSVRRVVDVAQGSLRATGNPLDIAIEGEGYLEVTRDGAIGYTRAGNLRIDAFGRLTTANGWLVTGTDGSEIRLTTSRPDIDRQGAIRERDRSLGNVKIVEFSRLPRLARIGGGIYVPADASVALKSEAASRIRQGYLETSNVAPAREMLHLMEIGRRVEMMQKVVHGYDDMLDTAISTFGQY